MRFGLDLQPHSPRLLSRPLCAAWKLLLWLGIALHPLTAVAADSRTGEQIYRQRCAKCHGASGEGTDENYPNRLVGDKSVAKLANFIAKKMPKDSPQKCEGEDAQKVAGYIYDAFYSKAAQERSKPPRIELARLTVGQYRHAVADLVGSFRSSSASPKGPEAGTGGTGVPPVPNGDRRDAGPTSQDQRGLRGVYFKSFGFRPKNRVFERIDPTVQFDFGETAPAPAQHPRKGDPATAGGGEQTVADSPARPVAVSLEPDRFSIRWEGRVLAPETGDYEFIVRTEHAARLWVNDTKTPLIDAWVKSGASGDMEHRASIFLLGGRVYPLRLEFAKGKQGEKDGKKDESKPPPVKASIALMWKLPQQQVAEAIPARNLFPPPPTSGGGQGWGFSEQLVVATPFPPDDRSVGYERGTSISKAWDQATTDAAIEVANYVVAHLQELSGIPDMAPDREPRLREFCQRFAERAFRRPLSDEQKRIFVARRFEGARDLETAVKRVVLIVLKSPQFLYREPNPVVARSRDHATGPAVPGSGDLAPTNGLASSPVRRVSDSPIRKRDGYDVASRISFGLWDSLPDRELLEAATAGRLATREQVVRQAERMELDPRTRAKIRDFLLQWLKVDPAPDLSKPKELFPGFDKQMASDLRMSLDLFLEDVVWGESSDYRQLFLADYLYLNGRLARFYGANLPPDAPFQKVAQPTRSCAGILSHPYLMATFAYAATTSPIHRGVFLSRNVLGVPLRPPPEAFTPLPAELHPELTTRERVALQTRPQQCQSCHEVINPLGFTLENFDAVGRYRDQEKGRPIDATGAFETRTGEQVKFAGVRDLATFLAGSEDAQNAFIERLFHCLVKQPVRAFGPRTLPELRSFFVKNHYSIRKLMVEMIAIQEKEYDAK